MEFCLPDGIMDNPKNCTGYKNKSYMWRSEIKSRKMNVSSGSWGKNGQIMAVDQFPNAFSLRTR